MRDPPIAGYMTALMDRETGPTVPPVSGMDLAAYKSQLVERFANPMIADTVDRVNADAPIHYLLDPIRDRLAAGQPIPLLALAVAAWIRRMRGIDEQGYGIENRHPLAEQLRRRAAEGGSDPRPVLAIEAIFGALGRDPRLIGPVAAQLDRLDREGTAQTLRHAVDATRQGYDSPP
jgi:fructuronate reductase/mannitol 2-dehydrogenase